MSKETGNNTIDGFDKFNMPETLTSLAAKYKITVKKFHKGIMPIEQKLNIGHKKTFTPNEIKIIIDYLGEYDTQKSDTRDN